jgi:hypothetical protein
MEYNRDTDNIFVVRLFRVFNAIGDHDLLTFTDPTESFGGTNKVTEFPYPAK